MNSTTEDLVHQLNQNQSELVQLHNKLSRDISLIFHSLNSTINNLISTKRKHTNPLLPIPKRSTKLTSFTQSSSLSSTTTSTNNSSKPINPISDFMAAISPWLSIDETGFVSGTQLIENSFA